MRSLLFVALIAMVGLVGCAEENPIEGTHDQGTLSTNEVTLAMEANENACWGQATKVFARTGEMGEHSSQQATPRLGLRNLARALYDQGVIADDSMQALGQFVSAELGLSIDACV